MSQEHGWVVHLELGVLGVQHLEAVAGRVNLGAFDGAAPFDETDLLTRGDAIEGGGGAAHFVEVLPAGHLPEKGAGAVRSDNLRPPLAEPGL